MKWKCPELWPGSRVFIIGGGATVLDSFGVPQELKDDIQSGRRPMSAAAEYLEAIKDKRSISINAACLIAPWFDVCFFGDRSFYLPHRVLLSQFPGIKIFCHPSWANKTGEECESIKYLCRESGHGISSDRHKVKWNHNSGFASISVARHLGAAEIVLIGFDMKTQGGKSHFHNNYKGKVTGDRTFDRHMAGAAQIAKDAKRMGIKIYNCSPISAIKAFEYKPLEELL